MPIRYFNFITPAELKVYQKDNNPRTKAKFDRVKRYFGGTEASVIAFIKANEGSRKYFTSIHKSKGREYETCIVVNSISEETLQDNGVYDNMTKKQLERTSFLMDDPDDQEAQRIHYVATTRSKHSLYFMMYDI